MPNPVVITHPLVQHKLTLLRDKRTHSKDFRELINEVAMLMCYEATRDLPLKEVEVETPMGRAKTKVLSGRKLAFVPILRAGLGMCDGMLRLVPAAKVGHIGIYRDPETHLPVDYYCKLPGDIDQRLVILLDPMLATGGSAVDAVTSLKERGAKNIRFVSILSAPEGIEALTAAHPDVPIYTAAVDSHLDENKYIIPGLGDAGDRIFGTK
jgi:uracil phosphoribosyltransferase